MCDVVAPVVCSLPWVHVAAAVISALPGLCPQQAVVDDARVGQLLAQAASRDPGGPTLSSAIEQQLRRLLQVMSDFPACSNMMWAAAAAQCLQHEAAALIVVHDDGSDVLPLCLHIIGCCCGCVQLSIHPCGHAGPADRALLPAAPTSITACVGVVMSHHVRSS
jgi:xanthine/CO dehydrogenase XdhC/CoxF family maturation factor